MGAIEDTRKVLQDFLAPELRSISVRLEALEKRLDGRIDSLEKKLDGRIDSLEKKLDGRIDTLGKNLNDRIDGLDKKVDTIDQRAERRHDAVMTALNRLVDFQEIRERLSKLESREALHQ